MARPAMKNVEDLRRYLASEAPFRGDLLAGDLERSEESLEALLDSFPRGAVTILSGVAGTGRMTLATQALSQKTKEGCPVAWVDGRGTLYPPALAQRGVHLERLLMVRGAEERAIYAAEQIIESGAFAMVVVSGVDRQMTAARGRRLQRASEGASTTTLLLLDPAAAAPLTCASLKLRLSRRPESIMVEVVKDRAGRAGRRALFPIPDVLSKCA